MPLDRDDPKCWFPAKRYGWGWGFPQRWQGWVFLVAWFVTLLAVAPRLPQHSVPGFVAFVTGMAVLLTAVCWLRGERPRWRWGGD